MWYAHDGAPDAAAYSGSDRRAVATPNAEAYAGSDRRAVATPYGHAYAGADGQAYAGSDRQAHAGSRVRPDAWTHAETYLGADGGRRLRLVHGLRPRHVWRNTLPRRHGRRCDVGGPRDPGALRESR